MTPADILAIKVAVEGVNKAQQELSALQKRVLAMQNKVNAGSRQGRADLAAWIKQQREHRSSVDGLASRYARFAGVLGTVSAAALTVFKAVQSFETLKGFRIGLASNIGDELARQVEAEGRKFARLAGNRFTGFMPQIQSLAGTQEVKGAELIPLLRAFVALGKKNGALPDQLDRAFTQFTQIASNGKVQGDELRIIQENMVNIRGLLKRAGLGDRIGSQSDPITFEELKKVLLRYGQTSDAAKSLAINSDGASAGLNRLMDTIQLDILPVMGKLLTPAIVEVASWLDRLAKKATPEVIERYGKKFVAFVQYLVQFAQKEGPSFINAIAWMIDKTIALGNTFIAIDTFLKGNFLKTLIAIAAIRTVSGVGRSAAGSAAGTWLGSGLALFGKWLWGVLIAGATRFALWIGVLAEGLPVVGAAIATFVASLGTAVAAAGAALIAVTVAVGAAIGLLIGWLINQIPGVQKWQGSAGEWVEQNWWGGAGAKESAATPHPDFQPGGRIYEQRKGSQAGQSPVPPTQSARRSDPQRLITEGGANGLRYAR